MGPIIAGSLVDRIGFSDCLTYIALVPISMFVLWMFMYLKLCNRRSYLKLEIKISESAEDNLKENHTDEEECNETSNLIREKSTYYTQT